MSKQTHNDSMVKGNETFYARSGQQGVDKRRKLWQEHMKRVAAHKIAPLDEWFIGKTHQAAKAVVAQYLVRKNKSVKQKTVLKNYGISYSLWYRYKRYNDGKVLKSESINSYIMDNWDDLNKAIDKSPSPTIEEVKRLFSLAKDEVKRAPRNHPKEIQLKTEDDHTEDYDHMLNDEQKVELMDLANLELSEIKPVTKSDLVVGVITGALVGGAMVAYAFLTNGAI